MFILKRMSKNAYEKCQQLNAKFAGNRHLQLHIDENEEERTLIYDYFRGNLFHFMNAYNQVPPVEATHQIMWETGKALEEMHREKMMHIGKYHSKITRHFIHPFLVAQYSTNRSLRSEARQHSPQLAGDAAAGRGSRPTETGQSRRVRLGWRFRHGNKGRVVHVSYSRPEGRTVRKHQVACTGDANRNGHRPVLGCLCLRTYCESPFSLLPLQKDRKWLESDSLC